MIKVAVGIILKDKKILLCQRKKDARYGLKWEFPGGKIESNEIETDCLKRELFEELSIDAKIGKLFHTQKWIYEDSGEFNIDYFLVEDFSGEIINNAFEKIEWIEISELKNYDTLEGNKEVVFKLQNKPLSTPL